MMKPNEDSIPEESYRYAWSPSSDLPLDEFLSKYKPSIVENDGTKPWIWVRKREEMRSSTVGNVAALEESSKILADITNQIENIKNDPSIPTRSNKKTGAKSKKEVREELQCNARERFKDVAQKHNYLCGKWLMFSSAEKIDMIWSSLATSLIDGPLAETNAFCAKVATTPRDANPNYQHVMCLYIPDVYDKDLVIKVMEILLRNHGFNLSGVKSDMYTLLGIDSKHPSGIPSTIWKNKDLMDDKEIQVLKNAFFTELKEGKSASAQFPTEVDVNDKKPANVPASSKLKKKQKDIFASDEEEDDEEQQRKVELARKKKVTTANKNRIDISEDESEDGQGEPKRKIAKRS